MIDLTKEQHEALAADETRVRDPETEDTYILVPEATYSRLGDLLQTGPLTPSERETILRGVWKRAGWDDPKMDDYEVLKEDA